MDNEHLTTDELSYHARLIASLRFAQAAWQSWSEHLAAKYALQEGEGIGEDGLIVRSKRVPAEEG